MNMLKTSLGCLFIALALNVAFSQGLAPSKTIKDDLPWLKVYTAKNPADKATKPESFVIYTSATPIVTQVAPSVWRIVFRSKTDYR